MNTLLLDCQNVSKTYQNGSHISHILKNVNFSLQKGEMTAILGSSGSGKSTLLHILGGLESATQGDVQLLGESLQQNRDSTIALLRNRHLGFVYQFHHLMMDFTALENVMLPMLIGKQAKKLAKERASFLLHKVGLSHRLHHLPAMLSGGERQRVAIARALVNDPALVLADEPTGNLDHHTAEGIFELLQTLNQEQHTAFLLVTHDLQLAHKLPRRLLMQDGVLAGEHL